MAATVTIEETKWSIGQFKTVGTMNLGTYATGGVAVTPGQFGMQRLDDLVVRPAGGYTFAFDKTNLKVLAYAAVQIIHNATPSAQAVSVTAADTGLEANFGATANLAAPQALNSADLSGITARFEATGY